MFRFKPRDRVSGEAMLRRPCLLMFWFERIRQLGKTWVDAKNMYTLVN
jgi:hypothetical protein